MGQTSTPNWRPRGQYGESPRGRAAARQQSPRPGPLLERQASLWLGVDRSELKPPESVAFTRVKPGEKAPRSPAEGGEGAF